MTQNELTRVAYVVCNRVCMHMYGQEIHGG